MDRETGWLVLLLVVQLAMGLLLFVSLRRRGPTADADTHDSETLPLLPTDPRVARCLVAMNYGTEPAAEQARRDLLTLGPGILDPLVDVLIRAESLPEGLRPATRLHIEEILADFGIPGHLAIRRAFRARELRPRTHASLLRIVARSSPERLPELVRDPEPLRTYLLGVTLLRADVGALRRMLDAGRAFAPGAQRLLAHAGAPALARSMRQDARRGSGAEGEWAAWLRTLPCPLLAALVLAPRPLGEEALAALHHKAEARDVFEFIVRAVVDDSLDPWTEALVAALVARTWFPPAEREACLGDRVGPRSPELTELVASLLRGPPTERLAPRQMDRLLLRCEGVGPASFASLLVLADADPETATLVARRTIRGSAWTTLPPELVRLALVAAPHALRRVLEQSLETLASSPDPARTQWLGALDADVVAERLLETLGGVRVTHPVELARLLLPTELVEPPALERVLRTAEGTRLRGAIRWVAYAGEYRLAGALVDVAARRPEMAREVADALSFLPGDATPAALDRLLHHEGVLDRAQFATARETLVSLAERN